MNQHWAGAVSRFMRMVSVGSELPGVVAIGQLARGVIVVGQIGLGLVAGGMVTGGVLWCPGLGVAGFVVLAAVWWLAAGQPLIDALA